jgi:hypothetical protein
MTSGRPASAFAELCHLQTIAQYDRVASDQVNTADMRVEVDADARPVKPSRNLFDMSGLTRAVVPLHHDAAIERESGEDREGRVRIKHVGFVNIGHAFIDLGKGRNLHVDVDPEHFTHVDLAVRRWHRGGVAGGVAGHLVHRVRALRPVSVTGNGSETVDAHTAFADCL